MTSKLHYNPSFASRYSTIEGRTFSKGLLCLKVAFLTYQMRRVMPCILDMISKLITLKYDSSKRHATGFMVILELIN